MTLLAIIQIRKHSAISLVMVMPFTYLPTLVEGIQSNYEHVINFCITEEKCRLLHHIISQKLCSEPASISICADCSTLLSWQLL